MRPKSPCLSVVWVLVGALAEGCAAAPAPPTAEAPEVPPPIEPLAVVPLLNPVQHFMALPVRVDTEETTAILDTGIGLALISAELCERIDCVISGEFTGQRMSGQAVRVPLTQVEALEVGGAS